MTVVTYATNLLNLPFGEYSTLILQCLPPPKNSLAFSSRATGCQAKSPVKEVQKLEVYQRGRLIVIDVQASAFLHHMVRNIAGVLMAVGCGKQPVDWVKAVLESRDRKQGAPTAGPYGLYFMRVHYPAQFDIPQAEPDVPFMPL